MHCEMKSQLSPVPQRRVLSNRIHRIWQSVQPRAAVKASAMPIKLIYFSLPARAEVARLLLTLGGVDFVVGPGHR